MAAAISVEREHEQQPAGKVGALMSQIEGRDHKLIAAVVDAKVEALKSELKGDIAKFGADIKYSVGMLAGEVRGVQRQHAETSKHVRTLAATLNQHLGQTDDEKQGPWWQNPRWLTAAAFAGLTVLAILLALGQELVTRIVDYVIGG